MKKSILFLLFTCLMSLQAMAQTVALKAEARDTAYVRTILGRSEKNISALQLTGDLFQNVRNIVANRYFELNDIYAERDTLVNQAKRNLTGDDKNRAIDAARALCDSKLYRSHFAFPAQLSLFLNEEQIEAVKDGVTMGVVKVTYEANLDMIPTLTDEEKAQILAWLKEARELALDAESSKKKHEVFGKYKGRINNYLSARGYDLVKEREAWYERVKARGGKL